MRGAGLCRAVLRTRPCCAGYACCARQTAATGVCAPFSYHQYVVLLNANTELADGVGASGGLGISWSFERVDLAVLLRATPSC